MTTYEFTDATEQDCQKKSGVYVHFYTTLPNKGNDKQIQQRVLKELKDKLSAALTSRLHPMNKRVQERHMAGIKSIVCSLYDRKLESLGCHNQTQATGTEPVDEKEMRELRIQTRSYNTELVLLPLQGKLVLEMTDAARLAYLDQHPVEHEWDPSKVRRFVSEHDPENLSVASSDWWYRPLWAWTRHERLLAHGAMMALDLLDELQPLVAVDSVLNVIVASSTKFEDVIIPRQRKACLLVPPTLPKCLTPDESSYNSSNEEESVVEEEENCNDCDGNSEVHAYGSLDHDDTLLETGRTDCGGRGENSSMADGTFLDPSNVDDSASTSERIVSSKELWHSSMANNHAEAIEDPAGIPAVSNEVHNKVTEGSGEDISSDSGLGIMRGQEAGKSHESTMVNESSEAIHDDCLNDKAESMQTILAMPHEEKAIVEIEDLCSDSDTEDRQLSPRDPASERFCDSEIDPFESLARLAEEDDDTGIDVRNDESNTQECLVFDSESVTNDRASSSQIEFGRIVTPRQSQKSPQIDSNGVDLTMLSQLPPALRSEARLAMALSDNRTKRKQPNVNSSLYQWLSTSAPAKKSPLPSAKSQPPVKRRKGTIAKFFTGASG